MDVAAASISLNSMKVQMAAGTSMAKKSMDVQENAMAGILQMMPSAPSVDGLGGTIDLMA